MKRWENGIAAVAPLLILAALLAGCSAAAQTGSERARPLDDAAWPTPRPTEVRPSPTPFPSVDPSQVRRLDDSRTPTPAPAPTAEVVRTGLVSDPGPVGQPVQTTGLSPAPAETAVTTARVRGPKGVNVRAGPGTSYSIMTGLRAGDTVTVLGLDDPARNWAFVQTPAGRRGWVSLPLLDLSGSPSDLPAVDLPTSRSAIGSAASQVGNPKSATPTPDAGAGIGNPQSFLVLQTSSGGDILVVDEDGSGLRRLTHGIDPVLSPDGRHVAFTRWNGTDGSLWVIDVDGGDEHQVAGGIAQAKHPAWAPDGKRIAVNYQHEGRLDPARKCASLAGGDVPDVPWNVDPGSVGVEVKGKYPNLIPYLCYTAPPDPHWSVRIVDLVTGKADDLSAGPYAFGPEWDPANPWRIVSSGLNGLEQLDVNRNAEWALTDRREDHTPAFSPDGKYIAVAFNNGGRYDIQRLDAAGGGRVVLTKSPLWLAAENLQPWNSVAPAWSPDSSRIAFLTDRTGRWEIWVMGVDGSNPRPMFDKALNDAVQLKYDFVDERMLSWGKG
jgi:hypothetical protein